jgi:1,4-alpha-glucan branching enzyme
MALQSTVTDMDIENHVMSLVHGDHYDPHVILGLHPHSRGKQVIRLWRPSANSIHFKFKGKVVTGKRIHEAGLFEYICPEETTFLDYQVYHRDGQLGYDPYAFWPSCSDVDQYFFGKGTHYQLYNFMGARLAEHQGCAGVRFVVWAPNAKRVSIVGDFNYWDGRVNPMRSMGGSGLWELFIPGLAAGEKYKFEIYTKQNEILLKSDPYAYYSELRPATASIVADVDKFVWQDKEWMEKRAKERGFSKPISIYEVHLGSWRQQAGHFINYRELAHKLSTYCLQMGFTHIELMPIAEHPFDESWGYQVTGFYAPTSRFGTPDDFQYFVNHMHQNSIGVLLDWVAGHFPTDEFALMRFDGTALYEHVDPRQGLHPHWNTLIFNFARTEVRNFLIANALFWLDKMHIDGLRVDAVASMLYLDYGRNHGEWVPNIFGGRENLEAIEFFKHLNSVVHGYHPGALVIAEESTAFPGITTPVEHNGLGFDMKWNMGWMNDTLRYFSKDPIYRSHHHDELTFGILYAFTERFMLVLSHDEVVHGKRSLLDKMPGDLWQKFANLRLLLGYMMCQPGKKLLFMGNEFGQWNEWYCKAQLDWSLLSYPTHAGIQTFVKEMNHYYQQHRALWEDDFSHYGFEWIDFGDRRNSVISYVRKAKGEELLCLHNFTPTYHEDYFVQIANVVSASEAINSDDERYGGSGKKNERIAIVRNDARQCMGLRLQIPPLATVVLAIERN